MEKLDHIRGMAPLLQVFDMPASLRFYRDLLGFTVIQTSATHERDEADWVLLHHSGSDLMLNTAYEKEARPSNPDPARLSAHEDLTLYFGYENIDELYNYLKGRIEGIQTPAQTSYGWKAIQFHDPDGYLICFHWPSESADAP